ncbi:MAG: N-acetyltransferase [Saprospiraceae bacterium]|nr:N-acetyltransferase [Saprospiraceae bacterium]
MQVLFEEEVSKGRAYIADEANVTLGEMTYSKAGEHLIIIDHTEIDEVLRGQGVGRKLLDAIVRKVRDEGKRILPLCPYAKSVFDKDESIRDVLQ